MVRAHEQSNLNYKSHAQSFDSCLTDDTLQAAACIRIVALLRLPRSATVAAQGHDLLDT